MYPSLTCRASSRSWTRRMNPWMPSRCRIPPQLLEIPPLLPMARSRAVLLLEQLQSGKPDRRGGTRKGNSASEPQTWLISSRPRSLLNRAPRNPRRLALKEPRRCPRPGLRAPLRRKINFPAGALAPRGPIAPCADNESPFGPRDMRRRTTSLGGSHRTGPVGHAGEESPP